MRNRIRMMAAACLTAGSLTAYAQEGIRAGKTVIYPFAEGEMTYDSNVFQTADGQDDVYWQYAGGVRVMHATDALALDSSAWAAQRLYDTYTQKDGDRWGLAGVLGLYSDKSRLAARLDFRQVDDYDNAPAFGSVPDGFEGTVDRAFDRTAGDEARRITDANLGAGHLLSDDLDLAFAYSFYQADYIEGPVGDWYENAAGAEMSLQVSDKTFSYLNMQYALQGGDGAPEDGRVATARVGFKNELTDKSTIRFGIGALHYHSAVEDVVNPSFLANGLWKPSEKLTAFVNARNEAQPTIVGNRIQISTRGAAGVRYQLMEQVGVVASGAVVHDKEQSGAKNETLTQVGTLQAEYAPLTGLTLIGRIEYSDCRQDAADDYDRFRGTLAARYIF